MQALKALIFKINRHALDDGPGIRTVIFFKGCPLRCDWCHNPESQEPWNEIGLYTSECIGYIQKDDELYGKLLYICDECATACPDKALKIDSKGRIDIDRTKCRSCFYFSCPIRDNSYLRNIVLFCESCHIRLNPDLGDTQVPSEICHIRDNPPSTDTTPCIKACPGNGLRNIGCSYSTDDLMKIIIRDKKYFETSGGGVTLSGGEPTLYMDYALELLKKLKCHEIPAAIETCGLFEYSEFKKMLPYLDLILFDIKLADEEKHKIYTGQTNLDIKKNLRELANERQSGNFTFDLIPRIPLIPGITNKPDNLKGIVDILNDNGKGISRCCLLPYNPTGFSKLGEIGKKPVRKMPKGLMKEKEISAAEEILKNEFRKKNMDVKVFRQL